MQVVRCTPCRKTVAVQLCAPRREHCSTSRTVEFLQKYLLKKTKKVGLMVYAFNP